MARTLHHESAGVFQFGSFKNISSSHKIIRPNKETTVPINTAIGESHDKVIKIIPAVIMIGVTTAIKILAMGEAMGKLPEKYIM